MTAWWHHWCVSLPFFWPPCLPLLKSEWISGISWNDSFPPAIWRLYIIILFLSHLYIEGVLFYFLPFIDFVYMICVGVSSLEIPFLAKSYAIINWIFKEKKKYLEDIRTVGTIRVRSWRFKALCEGPRNFLTIPKIRSYSI